MTHCENKAIGTAPMGDTCGCFIPIHVKQFET